MTKSEFPYEGSTKHLAPGTPARNSNPGQPPHASSSPGAAEVDPATREGPPAKASDLAAAVKAGDAAVDDRTKLKP
jgi:hypothetical protein